MGKVIYGFLYFTVFLLSSAVLFSFAQAQEEIIRIEYTEIFGKLRRPAIVFAHETHAEAMEEQGCGACHHAPDEDTGKLVYVEDEEIACAECHESKADDNTPALREAFHGSCNICHRQMKKSVKDFKGPTTCGECHSPQAVLDAPLGSE